MAYKPLSLTMLGLYATDDLLHPSYSFVMDRLYGTLGMRIEEWKVFSSKIKGKIYRRRDEMLAKDLLATRLTVAYDIVAAVKYMHARDLLHRCVAIPSTQNQRMSTWCRETLVLFYSHPSLSLYL